MSKKVLISLVFLGVTAGVISGYWFFQERNRDFRKLSAAMMLQKIIHDRDYAIERAIEGGDYKCCINPPCTMCYMEANQWNNFRAGTCACDSLIAKGKEPCPQCRQGLCSSGSGTTCGAVEPITN